MSDWLPGIDLSVYQGDVSQARWDALYAAGQRVAVVGSAHPRPNTFCEANMRRAKQAGFILATYAVVFPGVPSAQTLGVAKQMCGRFWSELSFVGIDCETDGITESQIFGMEQAILAENLRPVIYTGGWWWMRPTGMNNSQAFKHLSLWTANYREPPASDTVPLYGGWTRDKLVGHQWAGSVSLAGVTVDRNNFLRDFVEQEDTMSDDEQYRALVKLISECQAEANRQRAKISSDIKDLLNLSAAIAKNLDQDHEDIKKAIADLGARF